MIMVIGGGVSGLTTALTLQRRGHAVTIVEAEPASATVSWVAAAIWTFPDLAGAQPGRRWALRSREVFAQLAGDPSRGVAELFHVELFRRDPGPTWWESTPWVHRLDRCPPGYEIALGVEGFRIEPPRYLPYLRSKLEEAGGRIVTREIASLDEIDGPLVLCAGLGARDLAGDDALYPIRGQIVAVAAPAVQEGIADESDPDRISYVYPRSEEVIVGGTRQANIADTAIDHQESRRILADATRLDPRLEGAAVIEARVGLRPGRRRVRVERTTMDGRSVVHNYGHGGHGYLLSWGCAEDAARLVEATA